MTDAEIWTRNQAIIWAAADLRAKLIEQGLNDGTARRETLLLKLSSTEGTKSIVTAAWEDRHIFLLASQMVADRIESSRLVASGKLTYADEQPITSLQRLLSEPVIIDFLPIALERVHGRRKGHEQMLANELLASVKRVRKAVASGSFVDVRVALEAVPFRDDLCAVLAQSRKRPRFPAPPAWRWSKDGRQVLLANNQWHNLMRDFEIAQTVRVIVFRTGLKATRNVGSDPISACDIVVRALGLIGLPLEFCTVRNIYLAEERSELEFDAMFS